MPGSPSKRDRTDRWLELAGDPATMRDLCDRIVEGGTLREFCEAHDVRYSDVSAWISAENERRERFDTAIELRGEWLTDSVIRNLRMYVDLDIARAYGEDGKLLPITQMPEDIRRAIVQLEVDEAQVSAQAADPDSGDAPPNLVQTRTRKIKVVSHERAAELLGKYRKMFVDRVEHGVNESLEDLLTRSRAP